MGHISDLKNDSPIDPAEIFGKDTSRIIKAFDKVLDHWLYPHQGCYRSPYRPTCEKVRKEINLSKENIESIAIEILIDAIDLLAAYMAANDAWEATNPEEVAKEQLSRMEWESNRDRQFRIIYGIAQRHGLFLEWHGYGCGDQWTIYRHHKPIARIYCDRQSW